MRRKEKKRHSRESGTFSCHYRESGNLPDMYIVSHSERSEEPILNFLNDDLWDFKDSGIA